MSARRFAAGVATASLAVASLALTSSPASADPTFTPEATDIVGVGSDTSQFALAYLADGHTVAGTPVPGYNQGRSTGRLATFDATGGGTVVLQSGHTAITRPNGSGAGKGLLYGAGNNTDVDFARSSSALNATEASNGLYAFPFALDTLQMAVSPTSHAPASLTNAQIVSIYKGDVTNWSDLGGTSGVIAPKIPQSGSGTRSFFESELKKMNGGVAVTLGLNVTEVQEHDDTPIKDDANAVAPFSKGRAALLGTLRLETGEFSANRALYNVVRQGDVDNAGIQAVFGDAGFVCSTAARPLIEAAGFEQLARPANGGVCGEPTQTATSNFATNDLQVTTTSLTATAPTGNAVTLQSTVTAGAAAADGAVEFHEGATLVGSVPVVGGQATLNLSSVPTGDHTYVATFVPAAGAPFETSGSSPATVTVKDASTTTATLSPGTGTYGQARSVKATVTTGGAAATGQVSVKVGSSAAVTVNLVSGVATYAVPTTTAAGAKSVLVTYLGNATVARSTATKSLVIGKAKSAASETFPLTVKKGARATGTVKVSLVGTSLKAPGTVKVFKGTKLLKSATLSGGKATLTLPRLAKGTQTLKIVYAGTSNITGVTKKFTITQK